MKSAMLLSAACKSVVFPKHAQLAVCSGCVRLLSKLIAHGSRSLLESGYGEIRSRFRRNSVNRSVVTSAILWALCLTVHAEDAKPVTYDDHVATIFKKHCLQCHGDSKQEAGLNLASYLSIRKGGSGGEVVVAGRSSSSRLFKAITEEDPEARMPPQNDPLPKEQIALIQAWIDTGLRQSSGSSPVAVRKLGFTPTAVDKSDGPPPMPQNLTAIESARLIRPFPVIALAASPRAPLIAVSSYERIDFVDPSSRNLIGSVPFPEGEPHLLRFNRSGSVLLAAGGRPVQNGVAVLYDVKTGRRLAEIGNETDVVLAADLSVDEQQIAIGGSSRVVIVYSTETGSLVRSLVKHTEWITAIAYSPDGKLLATGDRVGNIHLWDAAIGAVVLPLSEHKASITSLSWRSDSQVLASSGEDGMIVWWDVAKGWPAVSKADAHPPQRPAGVFGKIANGVLAASFGSGGELVTCGRDRTVRLWASDGNLLKAFGPDSNKAGDSQISSIRILPLQVSLTFDGRIVVSGDSAGQLNSWPIESVQK